MTTPANGFRVWDWSTNSVLWQLPGDPGIPFAHIASLNRRWVGVDWNLSFPDQFYVITSDVANSQRYVGGPAPGTDLHGNGNWIQSPADLDDQWAVFSTYGALVPSPTTVAWLAPGGLILMTPKGQRRLLGHSYNTSTVYNDYTFPKFSPDGTYVMFTSNMNGSGRVDTFVAELPGAVTAPLPTPTVTPIPAPAPVTYTMQIVDSTGKVVGKVPLT
jgi:hypothetical protein